MSRHETTPFVAVLTLFRCITAACIRRQLYQDNRVKRCYSLKRNKAFRHAYRAGRSVASRTLVLVYCRNRDKALRVGFSVSKKLGNSVVRNRVKRRLRESFGPVIPCVKTGYDLIFIAREPVVNDQFANIQKTMHKLLTKADLYTGDGGGENIPSANGAGPNGKEARQ